MNKVAGFFLQKEERKRKRKRRGASSFVGDFITFFLVSAKIE
jgi:hypothetical protein